MTTLQENAYNLLLANKKSGYSRHFKRDYFYIAPDEVHYHQWFWDSCFHALVMSRFKADLAIKEIDTLFSCQTPDGFVPHIIFWKWRLLDIFQYFRSWRKEIHPKYRYFTAEIQPPVISITLKRIYEKTKSIDLLKKYLPKVQHYYDYLKEVRDFDGDGLISIITPMESGMDMAPQFDLPFGNSNNDPVVTKQAISTMLKAYKKAKWDIKKIFDLDIFNFEDVAVNTIYCLGLEALAGLWQLLDQEKSAIIEKQVNQLKKRILEKFWDEEDKIFYGNFQKAGQKYRVKIKTVASLFPLCLDIPEEYVDHLVGYLRDKNEFWTTYPVSSVAQSEKSFGPLTNTRHIWRGTTWVNTNWFLAKGLLRHGFKTLYSDIKKKTIDLIEKHGYCEYYDPFTGAPGEAMRNFGWSTIAIDI